MKDLPFSLETLEWKKKNILHKDHFLVTWILLYGHLSLDDVNIMFIITSTMEYILLTTCFDVPLFNSHDKILRLLGYFWFALLNSFFLYFDFFSFLGMSKYIHALLLMR